MRHISEEVSLEEERLLEESIALSQLEREKEEKDEQFFQEIVRILVKRPDIGKFKPYFGALAHIAIIVPESFATETLKQVINSIHQNKRISFKKLIIAIPIEYREIVQ